jgi:hypothetical protein
VNDVSVYYYRDSNGHWRARLEGQWLERRSVRVRIWTMPAFYRSDLRSTVEELWDFDLPYDFFIQHPTAHTGVHDFVCLASMPHTFEHFITKVGSDRQRLYWHIEPRRGPLYIMQDPEHYTRQGL